MDKERFFKRYDAFDIEAEQGSFFRYIDRVRLTFSIITGVINISELEKENMLLMHYPINRKHKLDELKEEWATLKNPFNR